MKKPYTWEDVEPILEQELKGTKHILTFGMIGSKKVENDIDTIVTKKPGSKTSSFYKELHCVFDRVNKKLRKYKAKVVCFSGVVEEEVLRYLGGYKKEDLGFHMMVYLSFPQMEIDWKGAQDTDLKKLILEDYHCLKGKPRSLLTKEFKKEKEI